MSEPIAPVAADKESFAFGYAVLGPIFAEYCIRLWTFLRFVSEPEQTCALFCARGGLRLKAMFERMLARSGLECAVPLEALMVSRLVAARAQTEHGGAALLDELGREFEGRPMAEVARALAQGDLALESAWDGVFEPAAFLQLLESDAPGSRRLRERIREQNSLFFEHLDERSRGRRTLVLCDTGLYGSTVRLLREAVPDRQWVCTQFARSNYKGFATPHFDCTVGLSVEQDGYSPLNARSAVLRFWQLVEAVLEPPLPSVRYFERVDGKPRSNLEASGSEDRISAPDPVLFAGAFAYLDDLNPAALRRVSSEAEQAWRELKRAITRPTRTDLAIFTLAERGRDFGRVETVPQYTPAQGMAGHLGRMRESLWREGHVARSYPAARPLLLAGIEVMHVARFLQRGRKAFQRRRAPQFDRTQSGNAGTGAGPEPRS